jgi:hypothetical protein
MRPSLAGPTRNAYVVHVVRDRRRRGEAAAATGGNQLKLSFFITGTPFGDAIREAYQQGIVVGGNAFAAKRTTPLLMSGAVIHLLPESVFDLASRVLIAHETAVPDPEVLEARAEADLRDVAREVTAEDDSPTYKRRLRCNRSR